MKNTFIFILITLVLNQALGQAQNQNLSQTNLFDWSAFMRESRRIGSLQFSPEGQHLLFSTRQANWETNRWITTYMVMDLATKNTTPLNFEQGVRAVYWSPSGKELSYLASKDGHIQLHVESYPEGKLKMVSTLADGVTNYSWSPDGKKIALIAPDGPPPADGNKFVTAFEVGPHGYLEDGSHIASHLYLWDLNTSKTQRLTEGSWTVSSNSTWSPDGQTLTFTTKADAYPSNWNDNKIMQYDLTTGSLSPLTSQNGFEYAPRYLAKGLVYRAKLDLNPSGMGSLMFRGYKKEALNLTKAIDRNIKSYDYLPRGNAILAHGQDGTLDGVWRISLQGKSEKIPISNTLVISDLAINNRGEIALIASSGNQPPEIFFMSNWKSVAEQLTTFHDVFKSKTLGKVEGLEWSTDNGLIADGVVTYPPDFSPNKKYPLVLVIHGGPTASSSQSFSHMAQRLAAKGWMVLQPNYRGSNNRGDVFQEAIMNDGGEGPGRDVMAGIKTLVAKGIVDEGNIGVTGWSYGGFMTSWLIGRYPLIWKAAVAGAPPVDYTDMTSLTRMNLTLRHAITNSPWIGGNFQQHFEMSPIKNLSRIKAPTLIMSKVEDQIVSVTGAYKLYHALLANDIPTKFVAYPGGGHFPSDPLNQKDVYDRWVGWLDQYLD